jgi:hypothetical protein
VAKKERYGLTSFSKHSSRIASQMSFARIQGNFLLRTKRKVTLLFFDLPGSDSKSLKSLGFVKVKS